MNRKDFMTGLFLAVLMLSGCSVAVPANGKIAIVGAKLQPGGGAAPIDYSIVLVEGGIFRAVGPQTSVPLPKDAEIVDGLGKTIEPAEAGGAIKVGSQANLILKSGDGATRTMREGQWLP